MGIAQEFVDMTSTSTFRCKGLAPGREAVFNELLNLIEPGRGVGSLSNSAEQSNHFEGKGVNVTANSLYFNHTGQGVELEQEEGSEFPSRSIFTLSVMLA